MWTKLAQDGLSGGVWAVDRLITNKVSFNFRFKSLPEHLLIQNTKLREDMA